MTTLAILADIRGNLPAREALTRDTECPGAPLTPALLAEFAKVDAWRYIPAPYHVRRVPHDS